MRPDPSAARAPAPPSPLLLRPLVAAALLALAFAAPARAASLIPAAKAPGAAAVPAPPAQPAPPQELPPAAIPLPELIRSAEEAVRTLRTIEDRLQDDAVLREVEERLPASVRDLERLGTSVAAGRLAELPRRELFDLRRHLGAADEVLARWDARLEAEVQGLDASSRVLARMEVTWRLTQEATAEESIPAAVAERIRGLRSRIEALSRATQERRSTGLGVQDQVAGQRLQVSEWLTEVDGMERAREAQLFEIESVPLWRVAFRPASAGAALEQLEQGVLAGVRDLGEFAAAAWAGLLGLALVFAALAVGLRTVERALQARAAADAELRGPAAVLAHPFSAGALLTFAVAPLLLPSPTASVAEVLALCLLPVFALALRSVLPAVLRRTVYTIGALFAVDRLAVLLPEYSLLARLMLLAVPGAALAGILRARRAGSLAGIGLSRGWFRALRLAALAGGAMLLGSLLANLVGNVSLARRLTSGTLAAGAVGAVIAGVALVLQALLRGGLRLPAAATVGVVRRHGPILAERGARYVRWAAVVGWVLALQAIYRAGPVVQQAAAAILDRGVRVGGLDVSLGDLVAFGVTLWISLALARFLAFATEEGLEGRGLPRGIPAAISKTARYAVATLGFVFAALASGMDLTRVTVLVGALGVGIGFGLQNVVNNFVSGLILLYERPVQIGDVVELGAVTGVVRRIGIRSSTISTFLGAEVVMPNADLISGQLVNWTLLDRRRRIDVDVGVAYGSDPDRVRELLLGTLRGRADVLTFPEPAALFTGFGESALGFSLRFWTDQFDRWVVIASEVRTAVCRSLAEAGIAIPWPQRELHLRTVDPAAARLLGGPAEAGERGG